MEKEQKLWQVITHGGGFIDAGDRSDIQDIFADGWTVAQMATPGPEGLVLLLMERQKPAGHAGVVNYPFGKPV